MVNFGGGRLWAPPRAQWKGLFMGSPPGPRLTNVQVCVRHTKRHHISPVPLLAVAGRDGAAWALPSVPGRRAAGRASAFPLAGGARALGSSECPLQGMASSHGLPGADERRLPPPSVFHFQAFQRPLLQPSWAVAPRFVVSAGPGPGGLLPPLPVGGPHRLRRARPSSMYQGRYRHGGRGSAPYAQPAPRTLVVRYEAAAPRPAPHVVVMATLAGALGGGGGLIVAPASASSPLR